MPEKTNRKINMISLPGQALTEVKSGSAVNEYCMLGPIWAEVVER